MNNPLISIIVPVYKAESFIARCVTSVIDQTFKDFELLLIEDGSPDLSGKICDELAFKDSRIRVFHKSNGGVSSARNLGLENALGEWICFLDSDDSVEKNWLKNYYENLDADVIVQGCHIINGDCKKNKDILLESQYAVNDERYDVTYKLGMFLNPPWNKCYRATIIKENKIRFIEGVQLSEDLIFVLTFLQNSKTLKTISSIELNYYVVNSNLTKMFHEPNKLLCWKKEVMKAALKFCKDDINNKEFRLIAQNEFVVFSWYVIEYFSKLSPHNRFEIYKYFREQTKFFKFSQINKNRYVYFLLPLPLIVFDKILGFYSNIYFKVYRNICKRLI